MFGVVYSKTIGFGRNRMSWKADQPIACSRTGPWNATELIVADTLTWLAYTASKSMWSLPTSPAHSSTRECYRMTWRQDPLTTVVMPNTDVIALRRVTGQSHLSWNAPHWRLTQGVGRVS